MGSCEVLVNKVSFNGKIYAESIGNYIFYQLRWGPSSATSATFSRKIDERLNAAIWGYLVRRTLHSEHDYGLL
jgi:hypothetical protein